MRKWLMLLVLLLALHAKATPYYVSKDGTGDGSANNVPMSPADFNDYMATGGSYTAAAGDIFYLKAGAGSGYELSASWTWVNDGAATDPISIVGCDGSWNAIVPTRTNWGALNTAATDGSVPYINCGAYQLNASGADAVVISGLRIASARSSYALSLGANAVGYGLTVTNSASNAAAQAINVAGVQSLLLYCDAACSGGTTGACVQLDGTTSRAYGCVVSDSASYGIVTTAASTIITKCLVYGCTDYGIYLNSSTTTRSFTVTDNTVYGKGIGSADTPFTALSIVIGNHCTDGSGWGVLGPASTGTPVVLAFNRTRDNSSGAISWAGTWDAATTWQHITSYTGDATDPAQDFVAYGSNDFRLLNTAAAIDKGVFGAIGAINLPAATLPAVSDVWVGVTNWGYSWAWSTGTKRASSIMNCEAGNIKSGVTIDDVTGSYAGGGGTTVIVVQED